MSLGRWSGRRIARLWGIGAVAEALLVLVPLLLGLLAPEDPRLAEFDWDRARESTEALPPDARDALLRELMDSLGAVVTGTAGDSLATYQFPDSSEVVVAVGGEVRQVRLSTETEEAIGMALAPIVAGYGEVARRLLWMAAAIYLPIPLTLGVLTAAWWVQRRRMVKSAVE